jgi:hypothetical protein
LRALLSTADLCVISESYGNGRNGKAGTLRAHGELSTSTREVQARRATARRSRIGTDAGSIESLARSLPRTNVKVFALCLRKAFQSLLAFIEAFHRRKQGYVYTVHALQVDCS